jgi:hypothetical protein
MAFTTHLRRQHAELTELARAFVARLDPETVAAHAADLRTELAVFTQRLDHHLMLEDDILYSRLAASDDPCVRRVAEFFTAEMSGLRPAFGMFARSWDDAAIARRPAEFCREARELFAAVDDRIRRENRELFPLADVGMADAPPLVQEAVA